MALPLSDIDKEEHEHRHVPKEVLKKIRASSMLVVLGTPGAVHSGPMRDEIHAFAATGRRVVPIEACAEFESVIWYPEIRGIARTPETPENVAAGIPAPNVVQRIENAFEYFRRDQVLNMSLWATVIVIALIIGGGYLVVRHQVQLTRKAQANATKSEADAAKAQTDAANAVQLTKDAVATKIIAEAAAKTADDQAKAAEARERVVTAVALP